MLYYVYCRTLKRKATPMLCDSFWSCLNEIVNLVAAGAALILFPVVLGSTAKFLWTACKLVITEKFFLTRWELILRFALSAWVSSLVICIIGTIIGAGIGLLVAAASVVGLFDLPAGMTPYRAVMGLADLGTVAGAVVSVMVSLLYVLTKACAPLWGWLTAFYED